MKSEKDLVRYRWVVKPGAIHVAQQYDFQVGDKNSPFSNHYDINRAAKKLGDKVNRKLKEDDPDFKEWDVFKAHEILLKKHIEKMTGRVHTLPWGLYEILPSEDDRFKGVGQLANARDDHFFLHTKQGVRMWEGNNNRRNGPRWPGIRYGIALCNELYHMAYNDNPYAQYELCKLENEIKEIQQHFKNTQSRVTAMLTSLSTGSGVNINIVKNRNPVRVQLVAVRNYGFQLVTLLTEYDLFVRLIKTMTMKGIMPNKQGNEILYDGGRRMRRMLNNLYLVLITMRSIKDLTRKQVLDDETRGKLAVLVGEQALPALPVGIWNYEIQPALLFVSEKMNKRDLDTLVTLVTESGLASVAAES